MEVFRQPCAKNREAAVPWPGGPVGWSIVSYTKRLHVQFPVRAHTARRRSMFLSHVDIFLSLPFPLSLKSMNIFLGEDLKK